MAGASSWLRRVAAWGLLLGLIAATYTLVAGPLLRAHERLDEAHQRTEGLLADFQRLAQRGAIYQTRLDDLAADESASGLYLDGSTEARAAADLQERVTTLIRTKGGTTKSSEVLSSDAREDLRRIAVRVQFTAFTAQIQQVLHALEGGRPLVFIDNLEIESRTGRIYSQNAAKESILTIRMDIMGYLRPEP
jgi:general secretion pathway protein M